MKTIMNGLRGVAVLSALLLPLACAGCKKDEPKIASRQIITSNGSSGLVVELEGPERLEGDIKQPEGMQFPIKMKIGGPADGAARIRVIRQFSAVEGCQLTKSLPMYVELNKSGRAEVEGIMHFYADYKCTIGFEVTSAAEFKPDPRHYELKEPTDSAEITYTVERAVDPGSPEMIRYTALEKCEEYAREELKNDGGIKSFSWGPKSVSKVTDTKYQVEGSFGIKEVGFDLRCTMNFNKATGWTFVDIEIPGLDKVRADGYFQRP